ncbi:putative transcription factor B3-Domain family [Helianthus annuus]|nr:putative transcription factor B3-Domain family [Helianthus annuus]
MIWGDQPPYKDSVKIVDGNNLWFVRVKKKTDVGPVLADGFTKVVRDSCVRKDDYLMFQSYGPSSFFLMVFKSCVHKNCFISKINPHDDVIVMADEFWRQFYGKNFKGGQSTLYLGDRFWNVNMDGLTDSCVFTHGCSEMINELALDRRSTFVFSLHGNKIFELSVFNHQTGTQIQNNRVELVKCIGAGTDIEEGVVVESEDDKFHSASFESLFKDIDDSKFDNFFSSLLEMEDLKKKFKDDWDRKTEGQGKSSFFCDEDSTMKDDPKAKTIVVVDENLSVKVLFVLLNSIFLNLNVFVYIIFRNMFSFLQDKSKCQTDLNNFLIPKNVIFSQRTLCSTVVSDAIPKNTVDVGQTVLPRKRKATRKCKTVMIVSDDSVIAHRTRSKYRNKNESVVVDKITAAETSYVCRKRSNLKRTKTDSFIEFTKVAENRLACRLPSAVSDDLSLSVHNLREVSIKNLRCEVTNIKTVAEENGNGYRYGFSKWSAFLKSNQIHIGATLFFKYVKSSQLLILTKVVHKTTKKRGRA